MSLIGNLSVYLTTKYNLGGVFLVNIINIWSGSCNFLSIPGAFVSDAYLGRFWTLLLGSIASFLVNYLPISSFQVGMYLDVYKHDKPKTMLCNIYMNSMLLKSLGGN